MNSYTIACFLSLSLICFTISCKTSRYVIIITDGDTTTHHLVLQKKDGSSADTIKVHEDDKVLWRIKTTTVHTITKIADKISITQPTFLTDRKPHKKFLSRSWVDKVNRVSMAEFDSTGYVNEFYFIQWKPKGSDSTKTFDPLIRIYPR
jgi:hypothetical protein